MRNGIYIVLDHRTDRLTRPLDAIVFAHMGPNQTLGLTNGPTHYGLVIDVDDDHPDFWDDGDRVVLPLGLDGSVELLWPTEARYDELQAKLDVAPELEWPDLTAGPEIQDFLLQTFFEL